MEMLIYIACVTIILSFLTVGIWKVLKAYEGLGRRTDAMSRLLRVGETWRADVRAASAVSQMEMGENGAHLKIVTPAGEKIYRFSSGQLAREQKTFTEELLKNVTSSQMQKMERTGVVYWQWDVEIIGGQKFTFLAVPSGGAK
ncbi:MAG TPA: hypothetical protein VGH19_01015 [Verrucomicrobiae bacterium]